MPKKQVTVKSDSLENLTSNATGGSIRSRRRAAEAVNYRESGGDDTLDSRKKMAVSPDDFPEPDAPIVRKKKPGRAKKVVIVSENNDLDIFGAIEEDAPPPPVKETSAKGAKVVKKKKAGALTENHSINQPTTEAASVPSGDASKSSGDTSKKVPPPPPSPKNKLDAAGAMNDTYVKETVQKEIRSSALTSQDLQLSEDSSDEDVEEKEKRKQKRQAEENPFSFKKYVEKVQTVPHAESATEPQASSKVKRDEANDLEPPSTSSSTEDLSEEKQETRHLELEHQLANRNRRIEELEKELKRMRKREAEETASLDKQLKRIETNYATALERNKALETENFRLQQKVERLQRGDVDIPDEYLLKQADLSDKINAMASGAEEKLNELLRGVKDLQQVTQLLSSMHKFSEENAS